jgi:hypothetical protein
MFDREEPDGYPPIRDLVKLVRDLGSKQFVSMETPLGVRIILPTPGKHGDEDTIAYLEEVVQKIETLAWEYDAHAWLCTKRDLRPPSPADARGPHEPPVSPD